MTSRRKLLYPSCSYPTNIISNHYYATSSNRASTTLFVEEGKDDTDKDDNDDVDEEDEQKFDDIDLVSIDYHNHHHYQQKQNQCVDISLVRRRKSLSVVPKEFGPRNDLPSNFVSQDLFLERVILLQKKNKAKNNNNTTTTTTTATTVGRRLSRIFSWRERGSSSSSSIHQ